MKKILRNSLLLLFLLSLILAPSKAEAFGNKIKKEELKDMLHKHLQFVTDQVVARLNKDWNADINSFDKGEDHMIMFADMLIDGIVKQFPEKFK